MALSHSTKWGEGVWWMNQYQIILWLCLVLVFKNLTAHKWREVQVNIQMMQLAFFFRYQIQQIQNHFYNCTVNHYLFIRCSCYISPLRFLLCLIVKRVFLVIHFMCYSFWFYCMLCYVLLFLLYVKHLIDFNAREVMSSLEHGLSLPRISLQMDMSGRHLKWSVHETSIFPPIFQA